MEVLEHLFSAELIMNEVKRVLKPQGIVVITVGILFLRGAPLSYKGRKIPFGSCLAKFFTDFLAHYVCIAKLKKQN